jgi:DNA-binding MarR family transcriptional regulator
MVEDTEPGGNKETVARRRKAILEWLDTYPRSATNELRVVAGCRKSEITPFLDAMAAEGLIRRERGPRSAVLWSLVPNGGN